MYNLFYFGVLSGLIIIIAAILGLVRAKKILSSYTPFIIYLWFAFINECITVKESYSISKDTVHTQVYLLVETYLLLWLFRNWGIHRQSKRLYQVSAVLLTAIWVTDNFVLHRITDDNSIYRICYSFFFIFLSIDQINHVIVTEKKNVLRNAEFLICVSFVALYTVKPVTEMVFFVVGEVSDDLVVFIYTIHMVTNFIINLILAYAVICIPTRQKFTLPY